MRLARFIAEHHDEILEDWISFAATQLPAAESMDAKALADHARQILDEIVANMSQRQGEAQRRAKSEGGSSNKALPHHLPSVSHARQRERQGFLIQQMIAEYRALRATVLRLWSASPSAIQIGDFEDVTRFNEAVDQAIAESVEVFVVEVDNSRELFLGVLGHDLRGPLSAITCSTTLLTRLCPQAAQPVAVLLRSSAHITALLDDLNVYTRQRLGAGFAIKIAPVQLDAVVRRTLEEVATVSNGRALVLDIVGDQHGEWDPNRLHQAMSNLAFNALKYSAPDSPIRIGLDGGNKDEVVLWVHNTGSPIPAGMLTKIFDPLVRVTEGDGHSDAQEVGASLGLGLYVVREIANAHGGTVAVASDETGTRFEMRLPRVNERGRRSTDPEDR